MTEEERKILQGVISGLFSRFVKVVAEGRPGLTEPQVRKLADGRIYTAEQARRLKFIDYVGYFDDAVALAKKLAGIKEAHLVFYTRAGEYRGSIYSRLGPAGPPQINLMNIDAQGLFRRRGPVFLYLWVPGSAQAR
jgi:protease-4